MRGLLPSAGARLMPYRLIGSSRLILPAHLLHEDDGAEGFDDRSHLRVHGIFVRRQLVLHIGIPQPFCPGQFFSFITLHGYTRDVIFQAELFQPASSKD